MREYTKTYYTIYIQSEDKTIIFADTLSGDKVIATEISGFHFGEPDEHSFAFIGSIKTTIDSWEAQYEYSN